METFVVVVVVAAAAGYLLRRTVSVFRSNQASCGCSGCESCSNRSEPTSDKCGIDEADEG